MLKTKEFFTSLNKYIFYFYIEVERWMTRCWNMPLKANFNMLPTNDIRTHNIYFIYFFSCVFSFSLTFKSGVCLNVFFVAYYIWHLQFCLECMDGKITKCQESKIKKNQCLLCLMRTLLLICKELKALQWLHCVCVS